MQKWYQKELFRNLVDMHIPNGEGYLEKFDPEKYAKAVQNAGATVAYLYGSNCLGLSFYPTKIGLRHKAAECDIFGETLKACRSRGLGVVGYLNSWGTLVCAEHPEWSVLPFQATPLYKKSRCGNPCINNEEYVAYFTSRVREFVSMYQLDGLWIDMVGIYTPVCFCEACKKKYGKPLPTTVDSHDPALWDYLHFKGQCVADYAEKIRAAAKEADPNISIAMQCAEIRNPLQAGVNNLRYYQATDYMSGDFYESREGVNVLSRILYNLTRELPFEFMTSRCISLGSHTMNKDINELILQSYAAMMYHGAFLFIDAIDPDGELDHALYEDLSIIGKNIAKYASHIDLAARPMRDVAVYFNFESTLDACEDKKSIDQMKTRYLFERMTKMDKAFADAHIDYDIITAKNLGDLNNYKAIILPGLDKMSAEEIESIRSYVLGGGHLYASGITSLCDTNGNRQPNFGLSDIFGVDYKGRFELAPNYISPTFDAPKALFGKHTKKHPHMINEAFVRVLPNAKSGKPLATVTLPISDQHDITTFSSALSNPPITETPFPALYENRVGKGLCIYSAGRPDGDEILDNQHLFTAIVDRLVGDYRTKIKAPSCVDYTVYEKENLLNINLLNHQTVYPPIPIADVEIKLRIGNKTVKQISDITGGTTKWSLADGVLTIQTDLNVYKMIEVEIE